MPPPSTAVVPFRASIPAPTAPFPKQDKTPPLYKLSKIPYTYFLSDQQTREARKDKRKNAKPIVRKSTGPTVREVNEAQLRKLILITIAGYGDADGTNCLASAATIAFDTGCGERCVSDHKAALEAAGYLSRNYRSNNSDDCTVHIPEHVWTEVRAKSAVFKEEKKLKASKGGWGSKVAAAYDVKVAAAYDVKVAAAYDVKVAAAYAADDLSLTSLNTSSLPLKTPAEENKQSLKDDRPKLVHGQRKPIDDFKLRVAKLTSNKILFTIGQALTLKKVLFDFTSDELFMGFSLVWDETSDDQIKYMASKFVANAEVQAQQGRDVLLKKTAEREAIQRKTIELQAEAEAERAVRQKAREAEEALIEDELPE